MMGINHAAMGGSVWIALTSTAPYALGLYPTSPTGVIAGSLVAAGSALLADADHHNASIAHSVPGGRVVAGAIGTLSGGHRHGTHSLLAVILVTLGAIALGGIQTPVGDMVIPLGIGIATTVIIGFGLKAMKFFRGVWVKPFIAGGIVALAVMTFSPGDWEWFPWAVGIGYAVHLLGDFLTTGGLTLLWPWVPKPPKWWSQIPVLNKLWMKNGYMSLPILGNAGSPVEYALSMVSYVYFAYGIFYSSTFISADVFAQMQVWWGTVGAGWDGMWGDIGHWWSELWSWLPF